MGNASERACKKERAERARLALAEKRAAALSNPTSDDPMPSSTGNLPDAPAESTLSQPPQPHSQSSARRNPPRSRSILAALGSESGSSAGASTETRPTRKTALAAQTLLQQVQLSVGDNSEEGSELRSELEDENSDDSLSDDRSRQSSSDIAIGDIALQPTGKLEIIAPLKKKSVPAPASRKSKKTPPVLPEPEVDSLSGEDDGKSLLLHI